MITNRELLLFNNKDHQVFDKVFRICYGPLYLYACHFIKNVTDAEDITMAAFAELYRSEITFNTAEKIPAYLFWLTKNRCLDFLKSQGKQKAMTKKWRQQYDDIDYSDPQMQLDLKAIEEMLTTIVNELPGKYGEVARLHYCEYLTYSEIAARLNISLNMVSKMRIYAIKEIINRLFII